MKSVSELQKEVHTLAVNNGWYDNIQSPYQPHTIAAWLCNIHGEVSEALEDVRGGRMELMFRDTVSGETLSPREREEGQPDSRYKPIGFPSELADIVIRCLDTASAMGIDLNEVIELKHEYNKTRSYRHGNKRL